MSRLATGLRIICTTLELTAVTLKIIADFKNHKGHANHHQFCDCLGNCFKCSWDKASHKESASA